MKGGLSSPAQPRPAQPGPRRTGRAALLAASLLLIAAQPARQLQDAERSRAAQQALERDAVERVRLAQAEERRLAELRVAAAGRLRAAETESAALAEQVAALAQRRLLAGQRLAERAAAIAPMLPLAERLALYPAETLLAVPAPPQATLRGLAVLRGLMQALEQEAALLRAEQAEAAAAEREIAAALPRLQAAQAVQAVQAAQLDREIAAARSGRALAEDAASDAARRAATEAARADSLRGAIAAMEAAHARAEQQAREDMARATQRAGADRVRREAALAEGRLRQEALARPAGPGIEPHGGSLSPVAGTVVRGWGDQTEAGPANGLSYRAPPLARVVAPCAGRVAFAGPFRSFGVLVILDCGGGTHIVLAGLERLDVQAGAAVRAGEPVGVMPGWDPAASGARPSLYVEVRRDGQPVNPAPFLRARG